MSTHGVLGESTSYPKSYNPKVLHAIPRALGRTAINKQTKCNPNKLALGMDWWQAFEVSWLDLYGVSQVAVARFSVPADSSNIVESKSLKLYLNSLNFTEFASKGLVQQVLTRDLSKCVGAEVKVELVKPDNIEKNSRFMIRHPKGKCIDKALNRASNKIKLLDKPDASLLDMDSKQIAEFKNNHESGKQHYKFYSHLLRSNCPVTNQPDWGTIAIDMTTKKPVCKANLLKYILSYRQHNGFHEQCVEQVFADLTVHFKPSKLMVQAWYTRRGGLDINPCRVSHISLLPKPSRLVRQ